MAYTTTRRRAPASRQRTRRTRRKNARFGRHRPVLIYGPRGWRRPLRKGKVRSIVAPEKRKVRVNRKRRNPFNSTSARKAAYKRWYGTRRPSASTRRRARSNPVRRYRRRRNPQGIVKTLTSRRMLFQAAKIGGGMVAGFVGLPMVYNYLPVTWKTENFNKFKGGINIALGLSLVALIRNRNIKDIGVVIAATGVYDMIAQNVPELGLPGIALTTPLLPGNGNGNGNGNGEKTSASYGARRLPVSPAARAARMAASYSVPSRQIGASYSAPGMRTAGLGSDNPYEGIEGWE